MIDDNALKRFIQHGLKKLKGEWLIVGGSVISLMESSYRVTLDIDIANISDKNSDSQLELMQIAEDINLPIEAINTAAAFFVHRNKDVRENIIEVEKTDQVVFYRPNFYLYLKLKSARLSETDLQDCLKYLEICSHLKEELLLEKCLQHLKAQLIDDENLDRISRWKKLIKKLKTQPPKSQ